MKLTIKRTTNEPQFREEFVDYEVTLENATLLELLTQIKTEQDATLTFASGCRSSVCGSCAVRVNGVEKLACAYKPNDGDRIEPLQQMKLIRDLVVDVEKALATNKRAQAWSLENSTNTPVSPEDEKRNEIQSDCILCGACYSACPVYETQPDFLGPFALTRVWRYVSDVRETDTLSKVTAVQSNGIWDCTLCGECVPVCPQGIAPKQDIMMLRSQSGIFGFMDPAYMGGFGGAPDFGAPVF